MSSSDTADGTHGASRSEAVALQGEPAAAARGKWRRRLLTWGIPGVALVGVAALAAGAVVANQNEEAANIGAAYVAQAACEKRFMQSFDPTILPQPDLPPTKDDALRTWVSPSYDLPSKSASGSVFGLFQRTAWHVEGAGCVLAPSRPAYPSPIPDLNDRVEATVGSGVGVPQPTEALPDADQRRVEEAITKAMGAAGTRGIVVMKNGKLVAERYAKGFDMHTPQLGWSMTKSLASVLMGRIAADDPNFDRAKPVGLPEWSQSGDPRAAITYAHLARMTSGLAWEESYKPGSDATRMLYAEPDMAAFVASKESTATPGTQFAYSTGSTTLLCAALQDWVRGSAPAAGAKRDISLAWKALFEPLGMASAELSPDATGTLACGSSGWATPRDSAKLGQFVAQNGRVTPDAEPLLPPGWMTWATTPTKAFESARGSQQRPAYGAGWWLNRHADGSLTWRDLPPDLFIADGHDGQFMLVFPTRNLVIVRQGFSPGGSVTSTGVIDLARDILSATASIETVPARPAAATTEAP